MGRVVIVGWDGASWELLDMLLASGRLPNLASLLRAGHRAPLRSTRPPVTAPAWVSMATGVNAGRHGCFDFNRPDVNLSSLRSLQSWDIREKTLYETLDERGRRFVLVNLPGTYPPLTGQITLTSLLTAGDDAVFPPPIMEKHPELRGYRVFPDTSLRARGERTAYLADIRDVERARFGCVKALWQEEWDLFFTVFSGTDWVCHEVFPELAGGELDRHPGAAACYEDVDRYLGWMLSKLLPGDSLLLVSDHGFKVAEGVFFLNEWLVERGHAAPDFSGAAFPASHRMEDAANDVYRGSASVPPGLLKAAYHLGPARYAAKVYRRLGGGWPPSLRVDPSRSRASMLTAESFGVTVHESGMWPDGTVSPDEVQGLESELIEELRGLRDDRGGPVLSSVTRRGEVYSGEHVGLAPNLVFDLDRYSLAASLRALPGDPIVRHRRGMHSPLGVFAAIGPGIAAGATGPELGICDVAPLAFYQLGEPVPEGLDGKIPASVFESGALEKRPPSYKKTSKPLRVPVDGESKRVQESLRGLGYME